MMDGPRQPSFSEAWVRLQMAHMDKLIDGLRRTLEGCSRTRL